jgi:beta-lactam-binding protein with PASTA domain
VVPKVAGKSLAAAEKLIRRARCAIGKITRPKAHNRQKPQKLTVSRTKPAAGTRVPPGTKVAIVLVHTHKPPSKRK